MFGVKEPTLLEKEVISRKTSHSTKATYICKSEETTAQHLKDLATATDPNETHAFKHRNEKKKQDYRKTQEIQRVPKDSNSVEEITSSRGKNVRRMERLAESAERVITSQKCVSSLDEGKKRTGQSSLSLFQ